MKRASHYVSFLSLAGGLGLLAYLLHRAGVNTVMEAMRLMGAAFIAIIVLSGLRHLLRTIAWRTSLDPGARSPGFLNLLTIRLIAESATDLSPAGPLLGEAVRAWAAAKTISSNFGVTSVVVEDLAYWLGTALFVFFGAFMCFASLLKQAPLNVVVITAILTLGPVVLAVIFQYRQAGRKLALRIEQNSYAQALLDRYGQTIANWMAGIRNFFQTRKQLFLATLLIEIAVNIISLGETHLILKLTTAHSSLMTAYLIESANRVVQLISSFVPFGLGVDEATTAATLRSLGHTLHDGVSVAVVRKIRSIFWDLIGLGLAAHFAYTRRSQGDVCPARKEAVGLAQGLELATQRRIS
jgi:uncharacterized membrane protein YbhN (UPF0104 family)